MQNGSCIGNSSEQLEKEELDATPSSLTAKAGKHLGTMTQTPAQMPLHKKYIHL